MQNKYVFILTLTFVCSLLLSLASEGLRLKTEFNIAFDIKKNILEVIGKEIDSLTKEEVLNEYFQNITPALIDINGDFVSNITHDNLQKVINNQTGEIKYYYDNKEFLPFYLAEKERSIKQNEKSR